MGRLHVSTSNYWQEIESMIKEGALPLQLGDTLKALINAHINRCFTPEATPYLVKAAKAFLQDGIMLSDSASDMLYDVMVYTAKEPGAEKREFFALIRRYDGCVLKNLADL